MSYDPEIDYYEMIGGIKPSSTINEIKKAYRKKVLEYHPDKNPGKEEWAKNKFLELKDIYETLIDNEKKSKYDKDRDIFLSSRKTVDQESRPGWTYTTNQNNFPINFESIPRTFVRSRPYFVYDYGKNSKQIIVRIIIYSVMFIMVLVTISLLSYFN